MKNLLRTLTVTLVGLLALTSAACTAHSPTTGTCALDSSTIASVALVQGNRAGTLQADSRSLKCYLADPSDRPVHSVVVVSDGSGWPPIWDQRWAPNPDHPRDERDALIDYVNGLDAALASPATRPEANTLEAILVAARSIVGDEGRKVLLVNDNLLQTAGLLPFQEGYLYADPAEITDALAPILDAAEADLTGIEVVLLAAGTAAGEQQELDSVLRAQLVRIWSHVLASRGAVVTETRGVQLRAFTAADLPSVTAVPLREQEAIHVTSPCTTVLSQNRVGFVPDSTEFLDPSGARATIASVAAELASCAGTVSVTGTTASGGDEPYRARLSEGRAQAVRAELAAAMGVPESTIEAVGVGMNSEYYVPDRSPSGELDPIKAQANRLVIIQVTPR